MRFFSSLYNSLYNFKWLRNQKDNASWAWGYFCLLIFLIAGLSVVTAGVGLWYGAPKIKEAIATNLPDFQAQISNGQLQVTGLEQPFEKRFNGVVVVVDTVTENIVDAKSFVDEGDVASLLITKNKVELYDSKKDQVRTELMAKMPNFVTDRTQVINQVNNILSERILRWMIVAMFVLLFVFLGVSNLLNVLFFSLLFYWIAKRKLLNWKFKEVFTVGLFTITLPMFLTYVLPAMFYMNFLFVLLYGGWMYMVILKKDKVVK